MWSTCLPRLNGIDPSHVIHYKLHVWPLFDVFSYSKNILEAMPHRKNANKAQNLGDYVQKKVVTCLQPQMGQKQTQEADNDERFSKHHRALSQSTSESENEDVGPPFDSASIHSGSTHLTELSLDKDVPTHQNNSDLLHWLQSTYQNLANIQDHVLSKLSMVVDHTPQLRLARSQLHEPSDITTRWNISKKTGRKKRICTWG